MRCFVSTDFSRGLFTQSSIRCNSLAASQLPCLLEQTVGESGCHSRRYTFPVTVWVGVIDFSTSLGLFDCFTIRDTPVVCGDGFEHLGEVTADPLSHPFDCRNDCLLRLVLNQHIQRFPERAFHQGRNDRFCGPFANKQVGLPMALFATVINLSWTPCYALTSLVV